MDRWTGREVEFPVEKLIDRIWLVFVWQSGV
jgi:hypothetical protein